MAFKYDINSAKKDKVSSVCLLTTHSISEIINMLVSTFLVGHIYGFCNNNAYTYIFNVGVYYLTLYIVSIVVHLILGPLVDKTNRVWLYRISLLMRAGLIVVCVFLGNNLAQMLVLAGILSGISEGFYYAAYNTMKQEMVSRTSIGKYVTLSMVLQKFVYIVFPITMGALIDISSYSTVAIYVLVIAIIQIGISFGIKSRKPEGSHFDLKGYFVKLKENPEIGKKMKMLYIAAIPYGLGTIVGVLLNVSIMLQFEKSFDLGWLTTVFSIVSALFIIVINKLTKKGERSWLFVVTGILPLIGSISFSVYPGIITIIIYNICNAISNITYKTVYDIYRNGNLKEAGLYSEIQEHQTFTEVVFNGMRVIAFALMLISGLVKNIIFFKVFLCICSLTYTFTLIALMIYEKKFPPAKLELQAETALKKTILAVDNKNILEQVENIKSQEVNELPTENLKKKPSKKEGEKNNE